MSTNYAESYLLFYPNDNDDWTSSSPFSGYTLTTESGFVVSNVNGLSYSNFLTLPSRLTRIGEVDRSVDLLDNSRSLNTEKILKGIGGIAKTNDLTFHLGDMDKIITLTSLMGRQIELKVLTDTSSSTIKTIFKGRINNIKPSRFEVIFIVRGLFQLWDTKIGALTGFDVDEYKNAIYPISYGDLSDDYAFLPMAYDKNMANMPTLYLGENKLKDVSNFYVWDTERKTAYDASLNLEDVSLNSDKTQIALDSTLTDVRAYSAISGVVAAGSLDTIYLTDSFHFAVKITSAPSLTLNDLYKDSADIYYEYVKKDGEMYIFRVTHVYTFPAYANGPTAVTKVDGSGPTPLTFDYYFKDLAPQIDIERTNESYDQFQLIGSDNTGPTNAVPSPTVIKIDDEEMLVLDFKSNVDADGAKSEFKVVRGHNSTSVTSHAADASVSLIGKEVNVNKWLVKGVFPLSAIANVTRCTDEGELTGNDGLSTYFSSVSNLNSLFEDFAFPATSTSDPALFVFDEYLRQDSVHYMDLLFENTSLEGAIKDIYLLGYFDIEADKMDVDLFLASGREGDIRRGRVGFNYYYAREEELNSNFTKSTDIFRSSDLEACNICSYTQGGANNYRTFSNNPISGDQTVKDFSLNGAWYNGASYNFYYLIDDNYERTFISNIEELSTTRFILGVYYPYTDIPTGQIRLKMKNVGLLIYFYVDPIEHKFWARGKGRIYDGTYSTIRGEITETDTDDTINPYAVAAYSSYVYTADTTGISGFTRSGQNITYVTTQDDGGSYTHITASTAGVVFCACGSSGVRRYTFNGTAFTNTDTYTPTTDGATGNNVTSVATHKKDTSTLVYVANTYSGEQRLIACTTADLTYEAYVAISTGTIQGIASCLKTSASSDYIAVACSSGGLKWYTYTYATDTFSLEDTYSPTNGIIYGVAFDYDGDYLFVTDTGNHKLCVFDASSDTLSLITEIRTADYPRTITVGKDDGVTYVIVSIYTDAVELYKWDATNKTLDLLQTYGSTQYRPGWYHRTSSTDGYFFLPYENCLTINTISDAPSNELIENPVALIEDLSRKELSLSTSNIDETAFQVAKADVAGQKAALTLEGVKASYRSVIEPIVKEHGLIAYESLDGKLAMAAVHSGRQDYFTINNSYLILDGNGLPQYTEEYSTIDKLYTELDIKYQKRNLDEFYGAIYDASSIISSDLSNALAVTDTARKGIFELETIRDLTTLKITLKRQAPYYTSVLRILTIYCTMDLLGATTSDTTVTIGTWCDFASATYIAGTTDKKYLVVGHKIQAAFEGKNPYVAIKVIEFNKIETITSMIVQNDPTESDIWQNDPTESDVIQNTPTI